MARPKNEIKHALRAELATLEQRRAEIRAALELPSTKKAAPPALDHEPNQPLWAVVRDALRAYRKPIPIRRLTEELEAAGHHLGTYPLRSVSVCISHPALNGTLFERSEDANGERLVKLLNRSPTYRGDSLRYVQQTSRVAARN